MTNPNPNGPDLGSYWAEQAMAQSDDDMDTLPDTSSLSDSVLEYRTLHGRTYHSDRGDSRYWGPNDERQNDQVDFQHHIWTLALEGRLYLAPLPHDIEYAVDIGTGTGLWAIDFGDMYPNCKVVGTDLSPIQPLWTPPNVQFRVDNFCYDWVFRENSLDYVHLRWLTGSVPDWFELMNNIFRCLKPGGWVETYDCEGAMKSDDGTVPPGSAMAEWAEIFTNAAQKMDTGCSFKVVSEHLQRRSIEAAGFVNLHERDIKIPIGLWPKDPALKELGIYQLSVIDSDAEGFICYSANALGWSQAKISLYAAQLRKELLTNRMHGYIHSRVVWAQKPID